MSFFKRIFGTATDTPADDAFLFRERVTDHRQRMLSAGAEHAAFLQEFLSDEVIGLLAPMAAQKMVLTQGDRQEHSVMIAKSPICYMVCTLALDLQQAAGWYERRYGGYGRLLEHRDIPWYGVSGALPHNLWSYKVERLDEHNHLSVEERALHVSSHSRD